MVLRSAGILLFRRTPDLEVFLGHPGGPLFARKDSWSIFKGEYAEDEDALAAAYREWGEETGFPPPPGDPIPLGEVVQRGGKRVLAWAVEGDADADALVSNEFEMTWPPRSGRVGRWPEIDRGAWMGVEEARSRMFDRQVPYLDRLVAVLADRPA